MARGRPERGKRRSGDRNLPYLPSRYSRTGASCREHFALQSVVAERVGFEPTKLSLNGFQDRRHQPLGHLSAVRRRGQYCHDTLERRRSPVAEEDAMKWVTRHHPKTDRVACPWLIRKFIDPDAQIVYVPPD